MSTAFYPDHLADLHRSGLTLSAQEIAQALAGERQHQKTSNGWLTWCPAHNDDKTPSLSIANGANGKLLVHCFGGCRPEAVIAALKSLNLWPARGNGCPAGEGARKEASGGLTLEEFAKAKKLDLTLLGQHGVSQAQGKGDPYIVFAYRGIDGQKIPGAVRFRFFMSERPKSKTGGTPSLYGLWRLSEFREGGELLLVEGESDTLTAWSYGLSAVGIPGKTLLKTIDPAHFIGFHTLYVWQEPDAPELPGQVAARLPNVTVKAMIPPPAIKDLSEAHIRGLDIPALVARLTGKARVTTPGPESSPNPQDGYQQKEKQPTQAEILIDLASHGEVFHDCHKVGYVTLPDGDIHATYPVRSTDFRLWLRRAYYQQSGKAPNAQALSDALGVLEAQALFDGPTLPVFVRVGEHEGRIYLDLGDPTWRAVEVAAQGWSVVGKPPVKFVRRPGMLPSPVPLSGGSIEGLRPLLNLPAGDSGEKTWKLIVSWLVMALRPKGPYPVLAVHGPQGCAKSTTARMIREIVDPNSSPLRAEPKEPRDLVISAKNGWCCCFDNLNSLPQWLSDGLCRLSTGGGFATRALYTDDEEALFEAMRPVILTGINPVATSQDLIHRQVLVELRDFENDDDRQEEAILWRGFLEVRPHILGALLTGVSMALRRIDNLKVLPLPRMADFAKWASAAEAAWGWAEGSFLAAYAENQMGQAKASVDADLVASTVVEFMREREFWESTPTELQEALTSLVPEEKRKLKIGKSYAWPQAPNILTRRLRKAQVFLKHFGIRINGAHSGARTIRVDRKSRGNTVHSVHTVQTQDSGGFPVDDISSATVHEEPESSGLDDTAGNTVHGKAAPDTGLDDMDGKDDISAMFSGEEVSL